MTALLGNLSFSETVVIVVLALLIFGDKLPQVAARAYGEVRKLRRTLDDMRRSTGIDRELRDIQRSVEEASNQARIEDPLEGVSVPTYSVKPRGSVREARPAAEAPSPPPPEPAAEPTGAEEAPTPTDEPQKPDPGS